MRPSPPPRSSGVFSSSAPPTAVRRLALSRRGSAENAVLLTCRSLWLSGRLTMAFARWLAARASPPCLPARSPVTCECSEIFSQLCALGRFLFFLCSICNVRTLRNLSPSRLRSRSFLVFVFCVDGSLYVVRFPGALSCRVSWRRAGFRCRPCQGSSRSKCLTSSLSRPSPASR